MNGALLLLDESDNVLVARRSVSVGEAVEIDGVTVAVLEAIAVGHKISRRALVVGDLVLKYGVPIGTVTHATLCGAWVHLHNMKSNYISAHTRDSKEKAHEQ